MGSRSLVRSIHLYWYNVKDMGGRERSIDFSKIDSWKRVEQEEEVNIVMIPRHKHGEASCVKAKQDELKKLESFGTYEEVEDKGQFHISMTWVMWNKGEDVRVRLVARGLEDEGAHRKDFSTIIKSAMRMILSVAASKGWKVKTTDIKSAFLQERTIERNVYISPPREACVSATHIWKLRKCLCGLNDTAGHFYQCSARG